MNIKIICDDIEVKTKSYSYCSELEVYLCGYVTEQVVNGLDKEKVLDCIDLDEITQHYGADEILDHIGQNYAMNYWNLREKEGWEE